MAEILVVGLGQAAAGDDGVGASVIRELESRSLPDGVTLRHLGEPSALVELLMAPRVVVIVDAVLGTPAGEVIEPSIRELASSAPIRLSSHGVGVTEAIALAETLNGAAAMPEIRIVAVTILRPDRYHLGLSSEATGAISRAADRVLEIVEQFRA
jgi:hydrogenase maturation protease